MTHPELAHLELLAEVDSLVEALSGWAEEAPDWETARSCRALVRRLVERVGSMRVRLEAPLVVATLGGTGTGKSALTNALVGDEVVPTGRSRPTTRQPTLICRPDLGPKELGIDPKSVETVRRDLPALAEMVLIDCPDPDTTEEPEGRGTNLARLRGILPHCDVLVVTTTQQKYRSARVADELAAAAPGARLVFVQTHADEDEDIRDDWREVLEPDYRTGQVFLVDSLAALADAKAGLEPRGEFAGLVDLLTRQLAGTAATRIRRANFLDLVAETLAACRRRIDEALPTVEQVETAVTEQRTKLAGHLAGQMRDELLAGRRQWESRLLGKVAGRWGFSPFALVLRMYQGLGGLLSGMLLARARSPAQLALWGAVEAGRSLQRRRKARRADLAADRAVAECWGEGRLREAALVIEGYAGEAGLAARAAEMETVSVEAVEAGRAFVASVSAELDGVLTRAASRHSGWFTRLRYETLLLVMLVALLVRPAKNFFYDSWLAGTPESLYGLDFYVLTLFWLVLWCGLLLWAFTSRMRRGLRREIGALAQGWTTPKPAAGIFAGLESECARAKRFGRDLQRLEQHVAALHRKLAVPDEQLGHQR